MVDAGWALNEGRVIFTAQMRGCYTVRHIIVCEDGDTACLSHEERHKREGASTANLPPLKLPLDIARAS